MEPRLFRRLVTTLVKELKREPEQNNSAFFFWIAFVGAYSITSLEQHLQGITGLQNAQVALGNWIRRWEISSGVSNWAMARAQLLSITWPEHPLDLGERVWCLVTEVNT
jgi:hypothetical protein